MLTLRKCYTFKTLRMCPSSRAKSTDESTLLLFVRSKERLVTPRALTLSSTCMTGLACIQNFPQMYSFLASNSSISSIESYFLSSLTGLGVCISMQIALLVYPSILISKLEFRESSQELLIYSLTSPFFLPSKNPQIYPMGKVNPEISSKGFLTWLEKNDKFDGSITIKVSGKWLPFVLDFTPGNQVYHPRLIPTLLSNGRKESANQSTNKQKRRS
jgi:hypothetical protein